MYVHTRDLAIENLILFVEKIHYPKGIFKYSLIYSQESHTHKYKGSHVYSHVSKESIYRKKVEGWTFERIIKHIGLKWSK